MKQDERWQYQYDQMMNFMEEKHRRPSKHRLEEHQKLNWMKQTKKMIGKEGYPADRKEKIMKLMEITDNYRR